MAQFTHNKSNASTRQIQSRSRVSISGFGIQMISKI